MGLFDICADFIKGNAPIDDKNQAYFIDGSRILLRIITIISFSSGQHIVGTRQILPGLVQPWRGYELP